MKIEKVIVEGFRSFGEKRILNLNNMTSLVGSNGVGKTSFLLALNRFFGTTQKDRTITNDDFFIQHGHVFDSVAERKLMIEVKLIFPELVEDIEEIDAVPECFRNMTVDTDGVPYCRMRLEATFTSNGIGDGDIRVECFWIRDSYLTIYADGENEIKAELSNSDRQRIKVIYTPASRDPQGQLQEFSGSLIGRFVKSINWQTSPEVTLKAAVDSVKQTLGSEAGVQVINEMITDKWAGLSTSAKISNPKLNFLDDDLNKMLKSVSMTFNPSTSNRDTNLSELSDGEKSLFYFSLLQSALNLKNSFLLNHQMVIGTSSYDLRLSFDEDKLQFPSLTVLAIEEPENHLSPHHFGHLVESFKNISKNESSQVIFSSHSPSIISRVQPEDIRYFRVGDYQTNVHQIKLPPSTSEASTYVKEAVKAYPELYFSKIIVLGEGDSEEIVFRKLFEAAGLPLDRSMISIVPLGGKHVNHFWRLLNDLNIPYVTLLDFDFGKVGAGWGRVKYCIKQLLELGYTLDEIRNNSISLTLADLEVMHNRGYATQDWSELNIWISLLQNNFNIYFSKWLDLDYSMLIQFETEYKSLIVPPESRGPNSLPPETDPSYSNRVDDVYKGVSIDQSISTTTYNLDLLNHYKYFFLSKGKPLTHALALQGISNENFLARCPAALIALSRKVSEILIPPRNIVATTELSNEIVVDIVSLDNEFGEEE